MTGEYYVFELKEKNVKNLKVLFRKLLVKKWKKNIRWEGIVK